MKKWILLALGLIAVYLALTYYCGVQAERSIRQQVALNNTQAKANSQPQVALQEYRRGFFRSKLRASVELGATDTSLRGRVDTDIVLWHGPLIFANGVKPGWFYAAGELKPQWQNREHQQLFERVFKNGLGPISLWGKFTGRYQLDWHIPAVDVQDSELSLQTQPSHLRTEGVFNTLDSQHWMNLGALQIHWGNAHIKAAPTRVEAKVNFVAEDIPLSDVAVTSEHIELGGLYKGQLHGLGFQQTQELVNGKVDTRAQLRLERAESLIALQQFSLDFALLQTSFAAIRAWTELSLAAQQEIDESQLKAQALKALRLMLHPDAGAEFAMAVSLARGDIQAQAQVAPRQLESQQLNSMSVVQLLQLLHGTGELTVAEDVLVNSPLFFLLVEFIATYMNHEPPNYVMRAALNDGQLRVNGQLVPLINLLPEAYR
ncbi:DUF945 family protein [Gilvimarinus sp. DA14]|uniref:DUF945 family protein n=1 Tax=Gilvimarinus sp. DA14 TaxID=2956798 RepID=UPI0020B7466B|nr:DUF945 family protein [Gilvimarinus sp. DA14]UTF60056.1 YdgA family protein [Gilvimarinus sp. DA14]